MEKKTSIKNEHFEHILFPVWKLANANSDQCILSLSSKQVQKTYEMKRKRKWKIETRENNRSNFIALTQPYGPILIVFFSSSSSSCTILHGVCIIEWQDKLK